jgi:cell division protein FtsL
MKCKKTKFEAFAQRFLIASMVVFVFGIVAIKAVESAYVRENQQLETDIETLQSTIDALEIEQQDLVSFTRLTAIAEGKGYTYKSDAVATSQDDIDNDGVDVE